MTTNERELFSTVFLEFHPLLTHFGLRMGKDAHEVEECIQELFVYFYEKNISFTRIENPKAYLFRAFRRRLLAKPSRTETLSLEDVASSIRFESDDFEFLSEATSTIGHRLNAELNALPWRQREAIYLKYFNRLSIKEIADIMEIQPQVVSNTLYKTLKKLRQLLLSFGLLSVLLG